MLFEGTCGNKAPEDKRRFALVILRLSKTDRGECE